jgi:hypothetical protein
MPSRLFRAVTARLRSKTSAFLVGDIEVFLQEHFPKTSKVEAALLYEILQVTGLDISYKPNVVHSNALITNYRPIATAYLEEEKPVGVAVTTPLVHEPALFAAKCRDADEMAVRGRVLAVANNNIPPPRYEAWCREYIELLVPIPGVGTPLELDDVIARQNKPTQRSRTAQALHLLGLGSRNKLKTFIKAEAYADVSDPRIITTCSTDLTIGMSRYTYAFKQANLERQPWYGPGMKPKKIARRLATLCTQSTIEKDFRRYDGSMSKFLQSVPKRATMRWYTPSEIPALEKHYQEVFRKSAVSQNGFRYSPGDSTRSGSPITTCAGTMINAFVDYCAYRNAGLEPVEAYKTLGLYAGDDSVSRNTPGYEQSLKEVVKDLGLTIETEINEPNSRTTFLSRVFPHPVTSTTSYQCLKRTLPKLHLSASKGVSVNQAAYNRAIGYLTTDSITPLLSDWCNKVVEVTGLTKVKGNTGDEAHKMTQSWPQDLADLDMIRESVAKDLDMTTAELDERATAIQDAVDLESMPVVWNNKRKVKITAIVDGELVKPAASPSINETWTADEQPTTITKTSSRHYARPGPKTQQRQKDSLERSSGRQSIQQRQNPVSAKTTQQRPQNGGRKNNKPPPKKTANSVP